MKRTVAAILNTIAAVLILALIVAVCYYCVLALWIIFVGSNSK